MTLDTTDADGAADPGTDVAGAGDLELRSLTKRFGDYAAVNSLDLTVPAGAFFALLGPSGCGKTTTLRMVAGLEVPSDGEVLLGGVDITWAKPYKRPVNTVFQSYALFPHLTIHENVAFGLRRQGRSDVNGPVGDMLSLVELEDFAGRKPAQLSGGQQQRVALARALINEPKVLLLDEPLGALDLKLRRQMQLELKRIQLGVGVTFVHVTHDQEEAMTMADTIAVMNAGVIEQMGSPNELYENPRTTFVANFLGQSNLVDADISGRDGDDVVVDAQGAKVRIPADRVQVNDGKVWLGVRPEKVFLASTGEPHTGNSLGTARIVDVSFVGVSTQYLVRMGWGQELMAFEQNTGARPIMRSADEVEVRFNGAHAFVLDHAQDARAGVDED
ncbi:MAG: ABC transporter ATP-binding protein [Nocardioidaceae bacterium]|nr:ABC transporter ATP-binding protein [Nocardioidaceae bacterium]